MPEIEKDDLAFLYPRKLGGGTRYTRPKTEEDYRARYRWLERRAVAEFDRDLDPCELASWVARMAATLRASAYRGYQAAIVQKFRDLAAKGELCVSGARAAVTVMRASERQHRAGNNRAGLPERCGSGRSKQLSLAAQKALVQAAQNRKRKTFSAHVAGTILVFGPVLGLRPWEWSDAVVDGSNLLVRTAKFSAENGTGLELVRELRIDTSLLSARALAHLDSFLHDLRAQVDKLAKNVSCETPRGCWLGFAEMLKPRLQL